MGSRTLNYTEKKNYLALGKVDDLDNFFNCNIEKLAFYSVFLVSGKSDKIESFHFAESSGLSC